MNRLDAIKTLKRRIKPEQWEKAREHGFPRPRPAFKKSIGPKPPVRQPWMAIDEDDQPK